MTKSISPMWIRLITLFTVIFLAFVAVYAWWRDGTSPVDLNETSPVVFVIPKGESVRSVSGRLAQERLVRSATAFYLLVKYLRIETQIQAGDFRLTRAMDAESVARELTHGIVDIWVTTLEGWRVEEIATKLARELDIPEREFLTVAREGYMFPDTYLIPREATAGAIAALFEKTFQDKVTLQMKQDALTVGLSFPQIVILSSIVEREGKTDQDRPIIAGILLNRLKIGMPLQADATVQYALGYQPLEKTWWKKILLEGDKKVHSPFNTYEVKGLPPSPIANPGLSSLRAVVYPVSSDDLYYLHGPDGVLHTAKTSEEHVGNINKFLRIDKQE